MHHASKSIGDTGSVDKMRNTSPAAIVANRSRAISSGTGHSSPVASSMMSE
jgi:hypothetical protein